MSDADLIARFQRGDRAAFDAIVEFHLDRVVGVARRFLSDAHEAQDVAQEVFLAAYRMLPRWRPDAQLFTWLYRATLNHSSKRLRARARPLLAPSAPSAPSNLDLAEAIDAALGTLSDRQREVFVLCHEEGVPLTEIASRLGLSLGTVKSHLHRALVALREALGSLK